MEKKIWHVYILECLNGNFYTGVTNNIEKRMITHQKGNGSKYVKRYGFKKLLYHKECENRSDACKKEYFIKQLKKYEKLEWFRKE